MTDATHRIMVEFERSTSDDLDLLDLETADPAKLVEQFVKELNVTAFTDGNMAGDFEVRTITIGATTWAADRLFPDNEPHVKQDPDYPTYLRQLAVLCKTRMEALRLTGDARETATFELFVGALQTLILTRHGFADRLSAFVGMVLPARGYSEVLRLLD
jgi:hypothetical protein